MKAYIYQADVLCEKCAISEMVRLTGGDIPMEALVSSASSPSEDSDHWPQGPYVDGGGESDTPQHCSHCQLFLENPLTQEGVDYVQAHIEYGEGDQEVLREWHNYYWSVMDFPMISESLIHE